MKKIIILLLMLSSTLQAMEQPDVTFAPVTVTFKSSADGLRKVINKLRTTAQQPTLVIWYSGEDGLTRRSYDFYTDNFGNTDFCKRVICYELSAWKALKDPRTDARTTTINIPYTFPSCRFFSWLEQLSPIEAGCVAQILQRNFIWKKSSSFASKPNGRTLDQIIRYPETLAPFFKNKDTALIYSALQYLEGLFLCVTLIKQGSTNIIFILPDGENDYYLSQRPASTEFCDDLAMLLPATQTIPNAPVNVRFQEFTYNSNGCKRPYLPCTSDTIMCKPTAGEPL